MQTLDFSSIGMRIPESFRTAGSVALAALVGIQIVRLTVGNLINDSGLIVWCASLTVLVALALAVVIQCRHELMRTDLNNLPPPTFDEWVEYCFTRGYADFHTDVDSPDYERVQEISVPYLNIDPNILVDYMTTLFEAPEFLADRYTDDQIGNAVWFLFGVASDYFCDVFSDDVEESLQVRCMRSVEPLYLQLFDHVCCRRGQDHAGDYRDKEPDKSVFMIWDMDRIEGALMDDEQCRHQVQPGLQVLENILMNSKTSTCMYSALHGLGHIHDSHSQRCEQVIDRFLADREVPEKVREYALDAREGDVL